MTAEQLFSEVFDVAARSIPAGFSEGERMTAMVSGICCGAVARAAQLFREGHSELARGLVLLASDEAGRWVDAALLDPEASAVIEFFGKTLASSKELS